MPIFMDIHENLGDVTEDDIKSAHQRDLDVQGEHGVHFLTYWFNSPDGQAFCLVDATAKEAAVAVHKASHGLVPANMVEVERPTVSMFMGNWEANVPDIARHDDSRLDTGLRAIMFTDLEGSTESAAAGRAAGAAALQSGPLEFPGETPGRGIFGFANSRCDAPGLETPGWLDFSTGLLTSRPTHR